MTKERINARLKKDQIRAYHKFMRRHGWKYDADKCNYVPIIKEDSR